MHPRRSPPSPSRRSLSSPLPQLLPSLDQFLHRSRRRKGLAVDDAALSIGALIEFPHAMLAEKREIMHDFLQVFAGPDLFVLADLWTSRHGVAIVSYSPFVRLYDYLNPDIT